MLESKVTKTVSMFGKELYTKEVIVPQEFNSSIDLETFSNDMLRNSIRTLNSLGYSIPDMSKVNVMWHKSSIFNGYICLFGTKKGFVNTEFTLYCYEK